MIRENLTGINLKQLYRIKENQYRSTDCKIDYSPIAVNQRIAALENSAAEKKAKKKLKLEIRKASKKKGATKSPYKKVYCVRPGCQGYALVTKTIASNVGVPSCACGMEMITDDPEIKLIIETRNELGF